MTGWSEQFIKNQRWSLIKKINKESSVSHSAAASALNSSSLSPYLRFKNGLFDVDKRFLHPGVGGVY
jgi:hypothetical protein